MTFDDITLMAYADDALDAETARDVAQAEANDPAVATRIAAFRDSRKAVAGLAPAPVPAALNASIAALIAAARASEAEATNVVPMTRPVALFARSLPLWQGAVAAGLALVIGLTVGAWLRPQGQLPVLNVAILADPDLPGALDTVASGARLVLASGGTLAPIATFTTDQDEVCREFEYDGPDGKTIVSVACRSDRDWQVRLAIAASAGADGYAPASSLETLDAWLTATGAGAPLGAAEEAVLLKKGS